MACLQTLGGLLRDCTPSVGGIAEVYIANHEDVDAVTVTSDKISSITMASGAKFYKYAFRAQTADFTTEQATSTETGLGVAATTMNFMFNRMDTTKRVQMCALAAGDLAVIVKDNNGAFWYFGYDRPVVSGNVNAASGKAFTDANGFTLVLSANDNALPYEVDGSIISGLL